jgi:hypothetical protein
LYYVCSFPWEVIILFFIIVDDFGHGAQIKFWTMSAADNQINASFNYILCNKNHIKKRASRFSTHKNNNNCTYYLLYGGAL